MMTPPLEKLIRDLEAEHAKVIFLLLGLRFADGEIAEPERPRRGRPPKVRP